MKSLSRASRSIAWGVVVVAAIFVPWGTMLISSVNRLQDEVAAKASQVRWLDQIERYALHRAGLAPSPVAKDAASAEAHDVSADRKQVRGWLDSLAAGTATDPALLEELPRLESGLRNVEEIGAGTAAADRGSAFRSPEAVEAISSLLGEKQRMEERLREDLKRCSIALSTKWKQLNFMTILSCALAVTLAIVLFAYDSSVAERRRVEAEEEVLRADLAHVGRLSVVGEMGTKVAHELNQPLGAISSYLAGCVRRLEQRGDDNVEMIQALEAAAGEAKRASSIIQRMRDFARNGEPKVSTVEINELVREVLPLLSGELRESHVEPELHLAESLEPVLVDRVQIGQVLVNLIRNSLEAMNEVPVAERRLILRTASAPDHTIEVSVEDTGSGLSPEVLENLFQPFHTTKPKGMGMGLAISRTIVEAHEGWIRAEPRRGQGAIFRFHLPCHSSVVSA